MITFSYTITGIKVLPTVDVLTDVVYRVDWYIEATDGTYSARYANHNVVGSPDPENFIPFEELTEEDVKGWIPSPLTPEMQTYLSGLVTSQAMEATAVDEPLPWASV